MQEILFFDKYARKILPVKYEITGDGNALVLPNVTITSPYKVNESDDLEKGRKRAIRLKKLTEQMLIERAVDGKYYI